MGLNQGPIPGVFLRRRPTDDGFFMQIDFAEIIIDSILITVWLGMTKYIVNNLVYQQYVYPDFKKNREPTKNDNK